MSEDELEARRAARQRAREELIARARERARQTNGSLILPPGEGDPPEVVGTVETWIPAPPGGDGGKDGRAARAEALGVLLDGAFKLAGAGVRLKGEPAGTQPVWPLPVEEPRKSRRARKAAASAPVRSRRKPPARKLRAVPRAREERPAPPEELRCTAMNSKGLRCKLERAVGETCLLHSGG